MEISGRNTRLILLFSVIVLIVSMLMFPTKYGTELPDAPLVNVVYELVFYGLVIHLMNRKLSPLQLVSSAGLCLIYRFALGAILGFVIMAFYGWKLKIALVAGMGSYLPGALLQVVATPFILRPVIKSLHDPRSRRRQRPVAVSTPTDSGTTSIAASKEKGYSQSGSSEITKPVVAKTSEGAASSVTATVGEGNGFEKATRYIGEDGSVLVAAVVDNEGLLLGNVCRRGYEAEDWAPFALLLIEQNLRAVSKLDCQTPERIDIVFQDKKVVVAREKAYCLMVVSERAMDDVLNIRINQGLEIVRKYVAERYSEKLIGNVEKSYV